MMLRVAAIFGAAVRKHTGELHLLSIVEGHDAVVQQVGRGERRLTIVELGKGYLGVGINKALLVDAPDPLHVADVEGVLGTAIARALALELTVRLLLAWLSRARRAGFRSGRGRPARPSPRAP